MALLVLAFGSEQDLFSARYLGFARNSLVLAFVTALVTVSAALAVGSFQRTQKGRWAAALFHISRIGYAVPGGVIAVGLMVPLAGLDNMVDRWME